MNNQGETTMRARIDAHFLGSASRGGEHAMREHLPGCEACRDYYERHLLLAELDPGAPDALARIGRGLGVAPRRILPWPSGVSLLVTAGAAVALFVAPARDSSTQFTTRGQVGSSVPAVAGPELRIFQLRPGQAPAVVNDGQQIAATADLAFAYQNPTGAKRAVIFGQDEHGHVYWYHPEWSDVAANPVAISLSSDPGWHELPAAVSHAFDGKTLRVIAVFTSQALSVREVEQALQRRRLEGEGRAASPLFAGATEASTTVRVTP